MDYHYYKALNDDDLVPIQSDLSYAVTKFAPHLAHVTHARVVCVKRSVVLSVHDQVAVKVNAPDTEAVNLQYVSSHTSLPVPKFFGLYRGEEEGLNFVVMEFVKGQPASVIWPSLSHEQKQSITDRLRVCFEELRTFSASCIGSVDFGSLCSDFLKDSHRGPFRNEDELNDALVKSLDNPPNYYEPFAREMLKSGHKIVLAHGDFALRNVMIHEGQLSGIIDWEYAGFYPEHWDYAVAFSNLFWHEPDYVDWMAYLQKILEPYPVEAAVLEIFRNYSMF